ncbi:MAG: hypothetical protein LIO91_11425 [Bacteroidales bacterium]|nr:hypothetical protein [Bacteroidales bacterium]
MIDNSKGLRYYTLSSAVTEFKFKKSGTWDNSIGGGSWSDTDWPYVSSESSNNISASIAAGETINLHYYTGLVFITGHYTYNKPIYLLGSFTNWHDSGDPSDSYKFTQTAENIWWLKDLNIYTNTEFKIFNYNTGYENATR